MNHNATDDAGELVVCRSLEQLLNSITPSMYHISEPLSSPPLLLKLNHLEALISSEWNDYRT